MPAIKPGYGRRREMLVLAFPAMAALAADPLLSLVDTALVGRLGPFALAALGINTAVFAAVFWVFNFLTYGTTAEIARLRGAKKLDAAARYAVQARWLALACGLAATGVLAGAAPWIVTVMGGSGEVFEPAVSYRRIRSFAAVPVLLVAVGHGVFRGLSNTRTPLWITLAANSANALLSFMLIHPAGLGVAGAAWGTLVAQTGAAVAFMALLRGALPAADLRIDSAAMRRMVHISRDLFLRTVSLLAALLVATAIAARMGTVTLAAHQVAQGLWTMFALVLDGFAIAGQAMVGTALGEGRPERAREDAAALVRWGLGAGVLIGLGYAALMGPLPLVFSSDAQVLSGVRSVWLLIALLQPVGGIVFVLDGILMGAGDFRFLLWSTALAGVGALVPIALVAYFAGWGLPGIWTGMAGMMAVRLLSTTLRLRGGAWLVPGVR